MIKNTKVELKLKSNLLLVKGRATIRGRFPEADKPVMIQQRGDYTERAWINKTLSPYATWPTEEGAR